VWQPYRIADIANNTTTCAGGPFTDAALDPPGTKPRRRITLGSNISATITTGAAIRFVRRVRYSLYQAPDNQWYLGYQDSTSAGWSTRSPVSGPHRAYSAVAGKSGLNFVYRNASGAVLSTATPADMALVARMDITLRGMTRSEVDVPGKLKGKYVDSLFASVGLRNRQ